MEENVITSVPCEKDYILEVEGIKQHFPIKKNFLLNL